MQSYNAMMDAFRLSMTLSGNPVQFVEVPYESTALPALYVAPPTAEPGACMIVFDGFDVSKEWAFDPT